MSRINNDPIFAMVNPAHMPMEALENELAMLLDSHAIFNGIGPPEASNSLQPVVDMYSERIRLLEAEILERTLLGAQS
jgi:hypothetical protein